MRILVSQAKVIESELKNPPLRSKTTFNINHEQEELIKETMRILKMRETGCRNFDSI